MSRIDEATAAALHREWDVAGATYGELAEKYKLDRVQVRQVIFARERAKGGPSTELVAVGGPASDEVAVGEIVAAGASYLPVYYQGDGPPPGAPQDVIDNWLTPGAKKLILRGKSPKTIKAYLQGMGWWVKFARANRLTIMPAPQNGMIRQLEFWEQFPVHVGCTGQTQKNGERCTGHRPSPSAVWIWYSGVKWVHGLGEPPAEWRIGVKLHDAMAGYVAQMKAEGWRETKAPRAYPDDVRAMVDDLDAMGDVPPPGWNDRKGAGEDDDDDDYPVWFHPVRRDMLRALVLACYYTGGRASDLASYRVHDVGRFPLGIELTLAQSKSKRGRRGEEKRTIHADADNPRYCGVKAIDRWLDRLAAAKVSQGALFRPVHKSGRIVVGRTDELSYMADVTGLTRAVRMVAKGAWQRSGKTILQNWREISIHSFRRGRVQRLLEEGADPFDIEKELGWAHGGAIVAYRDETVRQDASSANAKGML